MNLQQFKFIRETIRHGFNLTEAAHHLHTSQPGVSKAIIEFEEELGIQIFNRHGKRIKGLTKAGEAVVKYIHAIMNDVDNLKRLANNLARNDEGNLIIGCTHTQARYFLPNVIVKFKKQFPKVHVSLAEGNPVQLANMLLREEIDVALATETLADADGVATVPSYVWEHVLVMKPCHPLGELTTKEAKNITLEQIAQYPIVTYDHAFSGRRSIDAAFAKAGIVPDIVLEAIDADVIKTYVGVELGIGIIAGVAYEPSRDKGFVGINVGHLFDRHTTRIGIRKGQFVRDYVFEFIKMCSPNKITRDELDRLVGLDV